MRRRSRVKSAFAFIAGLSLLLIAGCGGGGGTTDLKGEVSGVIFDQEGFVVRGARVYFDGSEGSDRETISTTAGTYTLTDIPAQDIIIRAEISKNNVRYYGQNLASVVSGDRAKNVNIAVFPEGQLAVLRGEVRDREGFLLRGVRVFLRPVDNPETPEDDTLLTSAVGITDNNGAFRIAGLLGGLTYRVQVNALDYNSDFETITLDPREDRFINFTVPDGTLVNVPAPTNLLATVYTSPEAVRGNNRLGDAIEMMKGRLRPQRTRSLTRSTVQGNPIEADLFWDPIDNTGLLGYGIYRGTGSQALRNVGFLRDPRAVFYADNDEALVENVSYTYGITSLDTLYDGDEGESELSNTVSITPLGDLTLGNVTSSTQPTFRWNAVQGATRYSVFLFSEFPSFGVTEIFSNYENPVNATEYAYTGPALTSGRTYYYFVIAEREDQTAVSFSRVGQFIVP
ncbi:MAG: hypothetical protein ACO1SV_22225 [Fimbriimonas sp.]